MKRWTVMGADGYLGSRLAARLRATGLPGRAVGRAEWVQPGEPLGTVFYAIGLTADFRSRLADTMEAHVGRLLDLLRTAQVDHIVYFSSTRVYAGAEDTREDQVLRVRADSADQLYNLSKLAGESVCLNVAPAGVVARLSNVVGDDFDSPLFIPDVLRTAARTGAVRFGQAPASAKDYVGTDDALDMLVRLGESRATGIYNLGSGTNVSHGRIAEFLNGVGIRTEFAPGAPVVSFPPLSMTRWQQQFGPPPRPLDRLLPELWPQYQNHFSHEGHH